jgi:hypothetical protein
VPPKMPPRFFSLNTDLTQGVNAPWILKGGIYEWM